MKETASIIVLTIALVCAALYQYGTAKSVTFTVEEKERIVNSTSEGTSSMYLVFTDKGVFKNSDSIFYWKWNSSDLYGNLKEGKTYKAEVYGWRFGFFSMYPNIVEANAIN